jgi:hypothetical protein
LISSTCSDNACRISSFGRSAKRPKPNKSSWDRANRASAAPPLTWRYRPPAPSP